MKLLGVDVVHGDGLESQGVNRNVLGFRGLEGLLGSAVLDEVFLNGEQLVAIGGGMVVAALDDGVDGLGGEAEGAEVVDLGMEIEVAELAVFFVVAFDHDVLDLTGELGEGLQLVDVGDHAVGHLDADDDVGTHLTADVGGEVVDKAAVHQELPVDGDGREHAGDGHAGPDGLGELAATQHGGLAGGEVGGDAGEGDGQLVEVDGVLVADAQAVEEVEQVGTGDERAGQRADEGAGGGGLAVERVAEPSVLELVEELAGVERDGEQVGAAPVFVGRRDVAAVDVVAHVLGPVHFGDERLQLVGGVAQGIEAADDGAHAGAHDVIDGEADLLDVFQHADMGGAFGAAAAEDQAYLGPRRPDGVHAFAGQRLNPNQDQHRTDYKMLNSPHS